MNDNRVKEPQLELWKPNKNFTGAAAIFSYNPVKGDMFLSIMPQSPDGSDKKFNPEAAIKCKLGKVDLGEILAVLTGKQEGCGRKNDNGYFSGLYHETDDRNTIITFNRMDKSPGYFLGLSTSNTKTKEGSKFGLAMTVGESEQLRLFIENSLSHSLSIVK
jgi:hypothetical protein